MFADRIALLPGGGGGGGSVDNRPIPIPAANRQLPDPYISSYYTAPKSKITVPNYTRPPDGMSQAEAAQANNRAALDFFFRGPSQNPRFDDLRNKGYQTVTGRPAPPQNNTPMRPTNNNAPAGSLPDDKAVGGSGVTFGTGADVGLGKGQQKIMSLFPHMVQLR